VWPAPILWLLSTFRAKGRRLWRLKILQSEQVKISPAVHLTFLQFNIKSGEMDKQFDECHALIWSRTSFTGQSTKSGQEPVFGGQVILICGNVHSFVWTSELNVTFSQIGAIIIRRSPKTSPEQVIFQNIKKLQYLADGRRNCKKFYAWQIPVRETDNRFHPNWIRRWQYGYIN